MAFLRDYRAARRDEAELGLGVWRRAHDRFRRGLDRFHQILESLPDHALAQSVVPTANALADLLPEVRAVCAAAQRTAPSRSYDIPASPGGYLNDVHRELSRAGNAMAQAAEALTMARFTAAADESAAHRLDAVVRRAEAVREHVEHARELLQRG
ncbi:hypothetical protein QYM41_15925 [Kocuria sp. CPCC 205268]|uniref:hypothetical protein n=1 Tax=Kocuria oxytropis TaxID=3058913 RepID=UPI0034D63567